MGVTHPRWGFTDHAAFVAFVQRTANVAVHEPLLAAHIQRLRVAAEHDRQHRGVTGQQPHRTGGQVPAEHQLTYATTPTGRTETRRTRRSSRGRIGAACIGSARFSTGRAAEGGWGGGEGGGCEVVEVDGDGQVRDTGIVGIAGGGVHDDRQRVGLSLVASAGVAFTVDGLVRLGQGVDLGFELFAVGTGQEPGELHSTVDASQPQRPFRVGLVLG
ncbi:hypothetical protein GCM10009745_19940 [Kribbella yunnanensis]|uniref:Uncharacterized protein n=1 Tax=Kribbella yunnanensis TaxID=190194 RepID=A0ABP4SQI2_9ACTN